MINEQNRDKLVRDLTPAEAGGLLVHAHKITPERRKALLFLRGPANAYFSKDEQAEIRAWIAAEAWLSQNSDIADHPKLPTHWCDHCGHVESCRHDSREQKSEIPDSRSELAGLVARIQADLNDAQAALTELDTLVRY